MARLNRHFDLESGEEAKKLLIDALCDEALEGLENLKIWKAASLRRNHLGHCGLSDGGAQALPGSALPLYCRG